VEKVLAEMKEEEILEKIKNRLAHEAGEKTGGSGHLSHVSISDIKIESSDEVIKEGKRILKVEYSYMISIESEFTLAEETDKKESDTYDPYHYRKKDEMWVVL